VPGSSQLKLPAPAPAQLQAELQLSSASALARTSVPCAFHCGRMHKKNHMVDCHNQKTRVPSSPPPGGGERHAVQSVGKPSSTCTWTGPGGQTPEDRFKFLLLLVEESAYSPRLAWMCAPHRRSDLPERSSALEEA
jgi:hypothetical protein